MVYKLKIKSPRGVFFKTYKTRSHFYDRNIDKYILHLADGSYIEIPEGSKCTFKYSDDMLVAIKKLKEGVQANDNVSGI